VLADHPVENELLFAEAMPEGVVMLDSSLRIDWFNSEAKCLLKLDTNEQPQTFIYEIFSDVDFVALSKAQDPLEIFSPVFPEHRLKLRLCSYKENQYILLIQDITETYRLQAMREDFIANVSHELRTPLTVFRGYLELLEDAETTPANKLQDMLKNMTGQCARMERLVEDLLLLSRLENDDPDFDAYHEVNVANLLRNICHDAQSLSGHSEHEFILELDDELTLQGHSTELRSAFSNLIFNAVHYTQANGTITIRWFEDKNGKHMQVQDTGIGIAKKYLPRITQRFYRIDKSRAYRGKGGTGLGLAIVKHVLSRHHGQLGIESKLHEGSMFECLFN